MEKNFFNQVNRILVIKLRHLGDVLLSSPVFTYLKKTFPQAQIDAYIWKEAYPMLEGHPAISQFFFYDRNWKKLSFLPRMKKEMSLLRAMKKKKYDLALNLTEGDRGALAAWSSGGRIKVGVDPGKSGFWGKRKLYTHLVKPCPTPRHTVERDLDALRRMGLFPGLEERELFFFIPEEAKERAKKILKEEGLEEKKFVVIHAPSRWRFKCLPPHLMARVIDGLEETAVLTGSPAEVDMLQEIAHHAKKNVVCLGGKTSLKEMGALLCLAKGLITVDSVALHMASALKVPVVALFGPTSEKNWGPWQHPRAVVVAQNKECRPCRLDGCGGSKMSDCLWTLSAEEIIEAFYTVAFSSEGVETEASSASSLFVLNSLETNFTE